MKGKTHKQGVLVVENALKKINFFKFYKKIDIQRLKINFESRTILCKKYFFFIKNCFKADNIKFPSGSSSLKSTHSNKTVTPKE